MPELPEVEVTRRGIAPVLAGSLVTGAVTRTPALRYPLPAKLNDILGGHRLASVNRRGKYLLLDLDHGHLLVLDKHTTGDGLVSALQVMQACVGSGKSLAALLADVTLFPQTLINVRLKPGQDWQANAALASEMAKVEAELGDAGRVLIRASGTEPLVRIMVEARDAAQAESCAQRLVTALQAG